MEEGKELEVVEEILEVEVESVEMTTPLTQQPTKLEDEIVVSRGFVMKEG